MSRSRRSQTLDQVALVIGALVFLGHVVFWLSLPLPPTMDTAHHVTTAATLNADLDSPLRAFMEINPTFHPYQITQRGIASVATVTTPLRAAMWFYVLTFFLTGLGFSLMLYEWTRGHPERASTSVILALGFALSTLFSWNSVAMHGFLSNTLAFALLPFQAAAAIAWVRRGRPRDSVGVVAWGTLATFFHPAVAPFVVAIAGAPTLTTRHRRLLHSVMMAALTISLTVLVIRLFSGDAVGRRVRAVWETRLLSAQVREAVLGPSQNSWFPRALIGITAIAGSVIWLRRKRPTTRQLLFFSLLALMVLAGLASPTYATAPVIWAVRERALTFSLMVALITCAVAASATASTRALLAVSLLSGLLLSVVDTRLFVEESEGFLELMEMAEPGTRMSYRRCSLGRSDSFAQGTASGWRGAAVWHSALREGNSNQTWHRRGNQHLLVYGAEGETVAACSCRQTSRESLSRNAEYVLADVGHDQAQREALAKEAELLACRSHWCLYVLERP